MHMADLQASGMTWLVLTILSHPHRAGTGWHMTLSGLHILEPAGMIGRLRVYGSGSIECLPSTSKSLGSIPNTASTGLAANNCDLRRWRQKDPFKASLDYTRGGGYPGLLDTLS